MFVDMGFEFGRLQALGLLWGLGSDVQAFQGAFSPRTPLLMPDARMLRRLPG